MINTKVKEFYKNLEQGIQNIKNSEEWLELLAFQAKFHNYSFNNTLLIWFQYPEASYVKGFVDWNKLGRTVKKGSKSIKIFAPVIKTKEDEKGNKKRYMVNVKITNIFDISQTEGPDVPTLIQGIQGSSEPAKLIINRINELYPVKNIQGSIYSAKGSTNGNDINVKEFLSDKHRAKTLVHEVCHYKVDFIKDNPEKPSRASMETVAEGTAYVVCKYFGLDTSEYSFSYVKSWCDDSELIKEVGQKIQKTAAEIIKEIETVNTEEVAV